MKIVTVLGTRPEVIRLSRVIERLDRQCAHVVVHTGQNYTPPLHDVLFDELGVRRPDHQLQARGTLAEQVAITLRGVEQVFADERPDRLLVLGDTNSGLSAFLAKRLAIPVYHMEAGNRCYDDRVPEEVNRRVIDHCSDVLLPYTERSRQNLIREGIPAERIFVTGNPIHEVIQHHWTAIERSTALTNLGLTPARYCLATIHRAENVDVEVRLRHIATSLDRVQRELGVPVIVSTHPRTRSRLDAFGVDMRNGAVRWLDPFGFHDFVALERQAQLVLTDSGTVQEECAILQVPSVTLRDVTERPETIEAGSSILSGVEPDQVLRCMRAALERRGGWTTPAGYLIEHVSEVVARIVLGGSDGQATR